MKTTDEQRRHVERIDRELAEARAEGQQARARAKELRESVPPEWLSAGVRSREQTKKAEARITLGQAVPAEGEEYDAWKADVLDAERAVEAARKKANAIQRRRAQAVKRLEAMKARDAAGITPDAAALTEFIDAATIIGDHDPAIGKHSAAEIDREKHLQRARSAFQTLQAHWTE